MQQILEVQENAELQADNAGERVSFDDLDGSNGGSDGEEVSSDGADSDFSGQEGCTVAAHGASLSPAVIRRTRMIMHVGPHALGHAWQ